MKKGIDVSFAQGKIDWSKIKADFAIIRAGFGRGSAPVTCKPVGT